MGLVDISIQLLEKFLVLLKFEIVFVELNHHFVYCALELSFNSLTVRVKLGNAVLDLFEDVKTLVSFFFLLLKDYLV